MEIRERTKFTVDESREGIRSTYSTELLFALTTNGQRMNKGKHTGATIIDAAYPLDTSVSVSHVLSNPELVIPHRRIHKPSDDGWSLSAPVDGSLQEWKFTKTSKKATTWIRTS